MFRPNFLPIQKEGKVPAPHLVVIPPGKYNQEKEEFNQPNEVTNDKLLPRGYAFCHCKEYHLGMSGY